MFLQVQTVFEVMYSSSHYKSHQCFITSTVTITSCNNYCTSIIPIYTDQNCHIYQLY